jgi:hypothetical protein
VIEQTVEDERIHVKVQLSEENMRRFEHLHAKK